MKALSYQSPIYLQLREVVRTKIEEGEYLPGTSIPSENTLAETYGINRLTVRSAIDALVHEGLLKRVQGKGVFVVGEKVERDLDTLGGFTQTMKGKQRKPQVKVLSKVLKTAGEQLGKIFKLDPESQIYCIKRVCYSDDEPFSLEEVYIPQSVVPKLDGIDLSVFTIYEVYEFYGIKLKTADQTLDIAKLNQRDARVLGIDAEQPVFYFRCTSYDETGRVIEYAKTYTRADKCDFTVKFSKNPH